MNFGASGLSSAHAQKFTAKPTVATVSMTAARAPVSVEIPLSRARTSFVTVELLMAARAPVVGCVQFAIGERASGRPTAGCRQALRNQAPPSPRVAVGTLDPSRWGPAARLHAARPVSRTNDWH